MTRNSATRYLSYARYLITAQGPKLSYVNNYEPEYTRKAVRYNAPIVVSMFVGTFLLAEVVRRSRASRAKQ